MYITTTLGQPRGTHIIQHILLFKIQDGDDHNVIILFMYIETHPTTDLYIN